MQLTKGLIKADLIAARQAIEYYEKTKNHSIKNVAAYHIQQASEKMIKIQVYNSEAIYDNRSMYRHDIKALTLYAESLGIKFCIPDYIRKNSDIISDWEAGSRYDVGFSVRIDTLKKTMQVLAEWYDEI